MENSRTYRATVLGYDSERDVAVMSICCNDDFQDLDWETQSRPRPGTQILAVGYPSSASDRVIATGGEVRDDFLADALDMVAHDAPLNPGNSGGLLFSMNGRVWGVNVASSKISEGIFFAVPYWTINELVPEWKASLVVLPEPEGTPTPGSGLAGATTADLWVYLWHNEYEWIEASVETSFFVDTYDLDVTVRFGRRSEEYCNSSPIYASEPQTLSCVVLEQPLTVITGVFAETPEGPMRCERHQTSTRDELVYACEFRGQ